MNIGWYVHVKNARGEDTIVRGPYWRKIRAYKYIYALGRQYFVYYYVKFHWRRPGVKR